MNLTELKSLLISAKNELNEQLNLKRSKQIKYTEKQYFELVTFLSLWNIAGEDGSKIMNQIDDVPSGDALMQQLQKFAIDDVEFMFNNIYEKQFLKQFKKKKKHKAIAIIDVHEQETYSKDKRKSDDIRGGKHKNGTNFFFKFATIQLIIKNKIITLGVKIHRRGIHLYNIVNDLVKHVKKFVKIKVLLLDRGFRDVDIFNQLEYLKIPVLMPCIKDKKTRKQFEKAVRKFSVVKYYWKNCRGEFADFKLLMIKLDNEKEIGFYTTMRYTFLHSVRYYLNLYAKRWNIETGYRLQKYFLPKTTCVKGVVRYFYFCYAVAMHNLWHIIKIVTDKVTFTVTTMKFILVYFWITTHLSFEL
ncbi:MAG: transposase [Candidatus Woesearchaeota archaeon]